MDLAINSYIHRWLMQHPFVFWTVEHPIISLICFVVATVFLIRLFVAIYRLITVSIDRLWLWILRSPFLLLRTLFGWEFKPKIKTVDENSSSYEIAATSEQLIQICDRLEKIQQKQEQIMQELTALKKARE